MTDSADDAERVVVDAGVLLPQPAPGGIWCVGAVVLDVWGRAYVHRRSPGRRLLPGVWDLVGGHVEPGESVLGALAREVAEETGWTVTRVRHCLGEWRWAAPDGVTRQEVDYLVQVAGDLAAPRLEVGKHDAFAWVGPDELDLLREGREPGDDVMVDLVGRALQWAAHRG